MKRRGFIKALAGALTIPFVVKEEVSAEEGVAYSETKFPLMEVTHDAKSIEHLDRIKDIVALHDRGLVSDETMVDLVVGLDDAKCKRCGKTGSSLDEFTSPYTGLCVACSTLSAQKFHWNERGMQAGFEMIAQVNPDTLALGSLIAYNEQGELVQYGRNTGPIVGQLVQGPDSDGFVVVRLSLTHHQYD
jgi:hypothetical protein